MPAGFIFPGSPLFCVWHFISPSLISFVVCPDYSVNRSSMSLNKKLSIEALDIAGQRVLMR